MNRKEFCRRYANDPEGTWRDLAESETDPNAKMLYLSFAEAERERSSVSGDWAEDESIRSANELMKLAHNGPTLLERITWFFDASGTKIVCFFSRLSGILRRTTRTLAEFVGIWGALIILILTAGVWWQTFGGAACFIVILIGLISAVIAAAASEEESNYIPSWMLTILWTGVLAVSIGWKSVISSPSPEEGELYHAAYLLRDGEIRDLKIFSYKKGSFEAIQARVPFLDSFERIRFKSKHFNREIFSAHQPDEQTIYVANVNYHIEPRLPPAEYSLGSSRPTREEAGFETSAESWIENEAQRQADELDHGTKVKKESPPVHPLFSLVVDEISMKKVGKRIHFEDGWYRATPETQ